MFGWKGSCGVLLLAIACSGSDDKPRDAGDAGNGGVSSDAGSAGTSEPGAGEGGAAGAGGGDIGAGGSDAGAGGMDVPSAGSNAGGAGSAGEAIGGSTAGGGSGGRSADGGTSASDAGSAGESSGGTGERPETLPGSTVYVPGQILEFRFTVAPEDLEHLEEHGNDEVYVPAAVAVRGSALEPLEYVKVGLRHKGAWSLHHCWDDHGGVRYRGGECAKLSYKVKFSEYDEDARLDGMKRINLHAASGDGTKLHELVGYATFAEAGLKASRALPAKVYVNGELRGLFIAVEEVDGRFAKAHFPDGADGNLYKEIWPNANVDADTFAAALETNEEAADVSDIQAFAAAIADSTASTFAADMEPFVDVDALLRYLVVDRAIRNWDGITAFYSPASPHNFFWYHDDGPEGRFHLIPWDLDNTFWDNDPYMEPQGLRPIPNFNVEPLDCEPRAVWTPDNPVRVTPPRCDKLLDLLAETRWSRFVELSEELRRGPLSAASLNAKVSYWRSQIVPLVDLDPTLSLGDWQVQVNHLPIVFEDMLADFDDLVARGLVQEELPIDPLPELPDEVLNAPTENGGLRVEDVMNFEFGSAPAEIVGAYAFSQSVDYTVSWDSAAPLSGEASLLLDLTWSRRAGAYDEWISLGLASAETDIHELTYIVVTLATDIPRSVRVRVANAAYVEDYGDVLSEFGVEVNTDATPRRFVIPIESLRYPSWARIGWGGGKGWSGSDDEARTRVLERFNGLIFVPHPTLDAAGELLGESEAGTLRIDNIYFR
jgi:hypothetical protein